MEQDDGSPAPNCEEKGDDLIQSILSASNHYQVLGIDDKPATLTQTALRKAYLKRSVQVHPDKNASPHATEAFQRVAEAWNVLSDDETRAQYDARGSNDDEEEHVYTPPPPPSFQEALFAFAAATSMMGGGASGASVMSNMAQTLYWAEQLVQGRQNSRTTNEDENEDIPPPSAEQAAQASLALGSGLRVVAAGAKFLGFRKSAAVLDRSATVAQSVGVGTLVTNAASQSNPAIAKVLERGGEKAQALGGSLHRSIRGQLQKPSVQNALEKGGRLRKSIIDKAGKGPNSTSQ